MRHACLLCKRKTGIWDNYIPFVTPAYNTAKNLVKTLEIAKTPLLKAREKQKLYYDQTCRDFEKRKNIVLLKAPQVRNPREI